MDPMNNQISPFAKRLLDTCIKSLKKQSVEIHNLKQERDHCNREINRLNKIININQHARLDTAPQNRNRKVTYKPWRNNNNV